MIGKTKQITKKTDRKDSSAEKVFNNTDILLTIVDFIDDKDLLSFLLIKKSSHSILTKSKLIEIRMLRYELKNAEQTLQDLQIDYPAFKHKKKKRELNNSILSYLQPNSIPVVNISGLNQQSITKNLVYNILFGPKMFAMHEMHTLDQPTMTSIKPQEQAMTRAERFDIANCTDFEDYSTSNSLLNYPTGKIDNSYTQTITEAAFKYEVKKTQLKMMIHDYISHPKLPDLGLKEVHTGVSESVTKTFDPAALVQNIVSNVKNISNYIYPKMSSLSTSNNSSNQS